MRRAVRAIIIRDDQLLVMHRNKFGEEYDTLPGGGVELHETPEQALVREMTEETGVIFKDARQVFLQRADAPYGDQYVFLCTYMSGEPALHPEAEETAINKLGKNLYEPRWLPLEDLATSNFRSVSLRNAILEALANKWPENVVEIRWP